MQSPNHTNMRAEVQTSWRHCASLFYFPPLRSLPLHSGTGRGSGSSTARSAHCSSVKYTNPKGTITIALKKQNNDVVLSVSNTGEGIAPEHLTRIFDRFYRTDASRTRKHGGYGLGLAIAKSIVEQHNGKIYAKSKIGGVRYVLRSAFLRG